MNTIINKTTEYVNAIMREHADLYFPIFDDPYFILNAEDKEIRMIGRALAILHSYERDPSGQILVIGNKNVSEIEESLSEIREFLKDKGFDPELLFSNIKVADVSDAAVFREETKNKDYSLIILENAERYNREEPDTSEKLRAISGLRADRALITAGEDYDPGYEDPEEKEPGQAERGKYEGCGGEIFYNTSYSDYKGLLNAVMDVLGLKPDDAFRKALKNDDVTISMMGDHLFLLNQNGDHNGLLDNLSYTYGDSFESYANGSDIVDRRELFIDYLRTMQRFMLLREGRYLLNNYSIYNGLSITDRNRFMELAGLVSFSNEDKDRIIANYEKYAA